MPRHKWHGGERPWRDLQLWRTRERRRQDAGPHDRQAQAQGRLSADRHLAAAARYAGQSGRQRRIRLGCQAAGNAVCGPGAESHAGRQSRGGGCIAGAGHAGSAQSAVHRQRRGRGGGSFLAGAAGAQRVADHLGSGGQRAPRQCGHTGRAQAGRRDEPRARRAQGRRRRGRAQVGETHAGLGIRIAAAGARDHGADELHRRRQGRPLRSVRGNSSAADGAERRPRPRPG